MKISYLGIDNTYRDGAISAGAYTTDPKLDLPSSTLRPKRCSAGRQSIPTIRSFRARTSRRQVLRKVYTQPEQQLTWEFIQLLVPKYRKSYFGKTMAATFAERLHAALVRTRAGLPDAAAARRACPITTPTGHRDAVTGAR